MLLLINIGIIFAIHMKNQDSQQFEVNAFYLEHLASDYVKFINFSQGIDAVKKYLNSDQQYSIECIPVGNLKTQSALSGETGFHAYIRIPGDRILEWGVPTDPNSQPSIKEERTAKGYVIENMLKAHQALYPSYMSVGTKESSPIGLMHYKPYTNDCHTYVDRILEMNGEKPRGSNIIRITPNNGFDKLARALFNAVIPDLTRGDRNASQSLRY